MNTNHFRLVRNALAGIAALTLLAGAAGFAAAEVENTAEATTVAVAG
ncbi:hypothetical protein ACFSSC_01560 [Corynebacterium mendelii]|uniref:Uncharacterized protein n=1 Tax=Corynebacterium mendelii TaxID=2765362 RepID=A0A939E1Y2_9CORY|nr:hypothetical protein [Corynebacterium mendelii]MBN9643967.1 hypothetical protein [Corynebacterium mendelii]